MFTLPVGTPFTTFSQPVAAVASTESSNAGFGSSPLASTTGGGFGSSFGSLFGGILETAAGFGKSVLEIDIAKRLQNTFGATAQTANKATNQATGIPNTAKGANTNWLMYAAFAGGGLIVLLLLFSLVRK